MKFLRTYRLPLKAYSLKLIAYCLLLIAAAGVAVAQNVAVQADKDTGVIWRPSNFITGNDLATETVVDGWFADPSTNSSFSASAWRSDLGLATIATSGSASDLGTGTLPDARLSSNVPLLDAASNEFTGEIVAPGASLNPSIGVVVADQKWIAFDGPPPDSTVGSQSFSLWLSADDYRLKYRDATTNYTLATTADITTERSASATLTNKDISSATNTYRAATTSATGAVELATQAETDQATSATLVPTVATARRVMRTGALAQLYANILARQAAGEPINFLFYGDSLTNNTEYITRLRGLLQGVLGDGGLGWQPWSIWNELGSGKIGYTGWSSYDQNTVGAPTGIQAHFPGLAGVLGSTGVSTSTFSFTGGASAVRAASSFDLWYVKSPTGGTFTASTPGGDSVSGISSLDAGGYVLAKQAITGVKTDDSSGTYASVGSVSGDVGLAGINIKLGTTGLRLHNLSLPSSKAQQWAALDATSDAAFLADLAPDFACIELGMNDRGTRSAAEYAADITTLITRLRTANSDCVILLVASDNEALQSTVMDDYRDELITLATTYDCEFLDVAWLLDVSLIGGDTIHPDDAGYNAKAVRMFQWLGGPAMRFAYGITPYGQTYPTLAVDAASVAGYTPGDGLTESAINSAAADHLDLTAGTTNKSVRARYSGSGAFQVTDKNNTTYQLLLSVASTYAQIQAQTSGVGYRELRLNPLGGDIALGTTSSGISVSKTITAGATTGAQTINKVAGSVNFAAAATSLVVTNSKVSTSSVILATVATNDATMKTVLVVAGSGSFTIYANAAATAETRVNFLVLN
jgi:lysophospholipase L1-like esterase